MTVHEFIMPGGGDVGTNTEAVGEKEYFPFRVERHRTLEGLQNGVHFYLSTRQHGALD